MSEIEKDTVEVDDNEEEVEEPKKKVIEDPADLGEGWYGPGREAPKADAPPVPSKDNRRHLYTTVAGRVADDVFSDRVKSDRVWYTPEDEPEEDEFAFDVDISSNEIHSDYDIEEKASRRGDFFIVKAGKEKKSGNAVSIKAIDSATASELGQNAEELVKGELEMLKIFGNDTNICSAVSDKVYHGKGDEETLCYVLEPCTGDELFSQISRGPENYSENDARELIKQIFSALSHIHSQGYIHRDINDYVFVFHDKKSIEKLLLVDFSFSCKLEKGKTTDDNPGGVPEYQAPEVHAEKPFSHSADVWSAGVLSYALLFGQLPFINQNSIKLKQEIQDGKFSIEGDISDGAKQFIQSVLKVDAAERPSAAEVLKHQWLSVSEDKALAKFKTTLKEYIANR